METIFRTHWGEGIIVNMVHFCRKEIPNHQTQFQTIQSCYLPTSRVVITNEHAGFSRSPFPIHLIIFKEDNALIKATYCFTVGSFKISERSSYVNTVSLLSYSRSIFILTAEAYMANIHI